MDCSQASTDELSDEIFEVEKKPIIESTTVQQRLKEFSLYLVENVEYNLNFCLQLLEERTVPSKNSKHITALGVLFSAIPKIGGGVANALKTGETVIFRKIEQKDSKILADLVYYFSDNKESFRNIIIEAAIEVFASFENQFMHLTCSRGERKAMQQLAVDASDRIFNYLLITEQKRDITKNELVKGIIYGDSKRNDIGKKEGKTVKDKSNKKLKWKTSKLYSKAGIVILNKNLCYYNQQTNPEKYKYRKIFPWENEEEIVETWQEEKNFVIPDYTINFSETLLNDIIAYVMSQKESNRLEWKNYSNEAMDDRRQKHDTVLQQLKEYFNKIVNEMDEMLVKLTNLHQENSSLLQTVAENQKEENILQSEIISKLNEVHVNVKETKQKQDDLTRINYHIVQDIKKIKENQEEITNSVVTKKDVEQLVTENAKKGAAEGIKELAKETLRNNDPGPRIHHEFGRSLDKIKSESKRFRNRLKF